MEGVSNNDFEFMSLTRRSSRHAMGQKEEDMKFVPMVIAATLISAGCTSGIRPSAGTAVVRSQGHTVEDAELVEICRTLAQEFQGRFERTANVHGMPSLLEWYHAQLDGLMKRYGPMRVKTDMIRVSQTDSTLKVPVPQILKTETEKHNHASDGIRQPADVLPKPSR